MLPRRSSLLLRLRSQTKKKLCKIIIMKKKKRSVALKSFGLVVRNLLWNTSSFGLIKYDANLPLKSKELSSFHLRPPLRQICCVSNEEKAQTVGRRIRRTSDEGPNGRKRKTACGLWFREEAFKVQSPTPPLPFSWRQVIDIPRAALRNSGVNDFWERQKSKGEMGGKRRRRAWSRKGEENRILPRA